MYVVSLHTESTDSVIICIAWLLRIVWLIQPLTVGVDPFGLILCKVYCTDCHAINVCVCLCVRDGSGCGSGVGLTIVYQELFFTTYLKPLKCEPYEVCMRTMD